MLTANVDDDDGDGRLDGLQAPPPIDDELRALNVAGNCELRIEGAPQGEIRIWRGLDGGAPHAVDVVRGRSPSWLGVATITAPGATGRITITAAPILLRHPNEPIRELWVTDVADPDFEPTRHFVEQLEAAVPIPVRRLPGDVAQGDRWVQDAFQSASMNGRSLVIRLPRVGPTRELALLSPGHGLPSGIGAVATGVISSSSADFGGNVDVLAPHGRFTNGRLLVGEVSDELLAWLESQGAQNPAVRVETDWLASGHVDEIVMPLPSPSGVVRLAMASTQDGLDAVKGTAPPAWSTPAFIRFNQACQAKLDAAEAVLRAAVAPTPLEVVRVPVLFAPSPRAASAVANPVNALVVGETVLLGAPDAGAAGEALRALSEARYAKVGLQARWLDVSAYFRRGGSVHCAVEAIR